MTTLIAGEAALSAAQFREISGIVYDVARILLPPGKEGLVKSRLAKRLRARGIDSYAEYLDLVRDRASGVVGSVAEPFAAAFGARRIQVGPLGSRDVVGAVSDAVGAVPPGAQAIALVDAVQAGGPQRRALGMLAAARPAAIVVNTGLPAVDGLPLSGVDTYGSSRVTAEVVAALTATS